MELDSETYTTLMDKRKKGKRQKNRNTEVNLNVNNIIIPQAFGGTDKIE